MLLNEATLRIPLIVRWPGRIEPGLRIARPVQNVDILPSVLAAAGVPAPPGLAGVNLLAEIEAARERSGKPPVPEPARVAYMETYYSAHSGFAKPVTLPDGTQAKLGLIRRGVQLGHWKLVRTEAHALYDVSPEAAPVIPEEMARAEFHEELFDLAAGDVFDVISQHPDVAAELRALLDAQIAKESSAGAAPAAPLDAEMRKRLKALGYAK
jgi:arylsulfatase A-like enzyme